MGETLDYLENEFGEGSEEAGGDGEGFTYQIFEPIKKRSKKGVKKNAD